MIVNIDIPNLGGNAAEENSKPENFSQENTPFEPLTPADKIALEMKVVEVIKTIYDPEIPVDIYELGLIYGIKINDDRTVDITMTLTSPACPVAGTLPGDVETKVKMLPGVSDVRVELTFEPPWDKDKMSEVAKFELGFF
jgi:FeS assembly SUF system protein